MKIRSFIICAILALPLLALSPANAASASSPDQVALPDVLSVEESGVSSNQVAMQTFKPSQTGPIAHVDLWIAREEDAVGNLSVAIAGLDQDGRPDVNTILASTTISAKQVERRFQWITAEFDTPATLTAGDSYAIVLYRTTDNGWFLWGYQDAAQPEYQNGSGVIVLGGSEWFTDQRDFAFRTYSGAYVAPVLPSLAGKVNLIGTYGSITNAEGQIGVIGHIFNNGEFTYGGTPVGVTVRAAAVDCDRDWNVELILCDPGATRNSATALTQHGENSGYTSSRACEDFDDPNCVGMKSFVVIDLGEWSTYSTMVVFQMSAHSDGRATSIDLLRSSNNTDTAPVLGDSSWSTVATGLLNEGLDAQGSPLVNDASTRFDFAPVGSRYVLLQIQNDGSLGSNGYIEIAGVKLFGTRDPKVTNVLPRVKPTVKVVAPKFTAFIAPSKKSLSVKDLGSIKLALSTYKPNGKIVVRAYVYPGAGGARYSNALAKAIAAQVRSLRPKATVTIETLSCSSAPRAARGSSWTPGSYRVDLVTTN